MNKLLLALVALLALGSMPAFAGEESMEQTLFKALDVDKDGIVSKTEAAKDETLSKNWADVDTNMNDTIEEAEFARFEETLETTD